MMTRSLAVRQQLRKQAWKTKCNTRSRRGLVRRLVVHPCTLFTVGQRHETRVGTSPAVPHLGLCCHGSLQSTKIACTSRPPAAHNMRPPTENAAHEEANCQHNDQFRKHAPILQHASRRHQLALTMLANFMATIYTNQQQREQHHCSQSPTSEHHGRRCCWGARKKKRCKINLEPNVLRRHNIKI